MTTEVHDPRWRELLAKLFVSRGSRGGELVVLDDILPVAPLFDAAEGEYHRNRGEKMWSYFNLIASGAGTFATGKFQNPADSGKLVVIEHAEVSYASALMAIVGLVQPITTPPGAAIAWVMDTRQFATGALYPNILDAPVIDQTPLAGGLSYPAAVGAALPVGSARTALFGAEIDVILKPGTEFLISSATAGANSFYINIMGYTRAVDPAELL